MQGPALAWTLLLLALVAVPATATGPTATIAAPIAFDGPVDLATTGGVLDLNDGTVPFMAAVTYGSVEVWSERTTCLQRDLSTCVPSTTSAQTRSIQLGPGGMSVDAPETGAYRVLLTAANGSRIVLSTDGGRLDVLADEATRRLADRPDAEQYSAETLPTGVVAHLPAGATLEAAGELTVRTLNATLTVIDHEGRSQVLVTGWSWVQGDGPQWYRQLLLATVHIEGAFTAAWDGTLTAAPRLPLAIDGDVDLDVIEGALEPGDGLRITGVDAGRGERGAFLAEQGVVATETPDKDDETSPVAVGVAGAALVAALGAVTYYWPRLSWGLAVVGLPMYSRIQKSEVLDHDVRETLYQLIQDEPGVHAHALAEKAGIGWGTTVYHLRLMERNRLVTSQRHGRYRRFFPAAGYLAKKREVLSVLQNETTNAIARLVLREPGLNQKAVCESLGISPSLANWHLNRLLEAQLVGRERRGRTVHYFPGEAWNDLAP